MLRVRFGLMSVAILLCATGCPNDCEKGAKDIVARYKECGVPTSENESSETTMAECTEASGKLSRCQAICTQFSPCSVFTDAANTPSIFLNASALCFTKCLEGAESPKPCESNQVYATYGNDVLVCVTDDRTGFSTDMSAPNDMSQAAGTISSLAAGSDFSCAIVGGTVKCWGTNVFKQSGLATGNTVLTPSAANPPLSNSTLLALGSQHGCAFSSGKLSCWGASGDGQAGSMSSSIVPTDVSAVGSGVTALATGDRHTCAVSGGNVYCWGNNEGGQLGTGGPMNTPISTPAKIITGGATLVASGGTHSCAVVDEKIKCWGRNDSGQLGHSGGDTTTPMDGPTLTNVTALTAGSLHTCAIVNGGAKCWGRNQEGQLGNNLNDDSSDPVDVSGLSSGVTAISAGETHTCAVVNGAAKCWGNNNKNQLGATGAGTTVNHPVDVTGLSSGVTLIAAGLAHSCASVVSEGVECWGHGTSGQLGNGMTGAGASSATPVPVQF